MTDEPRIPEQLTRRINDFRSEDWITEDEAAVLNADRVARGAEPLNVLQWRLRAVLANEQHPKAYRAWRRSVEQICNRAEIIKTLQAFP